MKLIRYEAARAALAAAHRVDEVKDIRDKAQAMVAYARQRNDVELERWVAEIKLRACIRMGELSAELDEAPGRRTDKPLPASGKKSKSEVLKAAGISTSAAQRYERLAEDSERVERYIAEKAARGEPVTIKEALAPGSVRTQTSGDEEWYTPAKYLDLARTVLGAIDLDPASNAFAQKTVKAETYFDAKADGLTKNWTGTVWLNPPYSRGLMDSFVAKLCTEVTAGRTTAAILLTHNFTDTAWFRAAWEAASAVCFTHGRIRFYNERGQGDSPTSGHVFLYYGRDPQKFLRTFKAIGNVGVPHVD